MCYSMTAVALESIAGRHPHSYLVHKFAQQRAGQPGIAGGRADVSLSSP